MMHSFRETLLLCVFFVGIAFAQLSSDYYATSCPKALSTIKTGVCKAVAAENRMGASLLRLHFHDCFVNGCDASVLLNDTATFTGEKTALPNAGSLRGFDVIDNVKAQVESICPGVVSCADILAVAARDSVVALGGLGWTVQLGRKDSMTASLSDANSDIPSPIMDLDALIAAFSKKGLTAKEMVALSGAHTIGSARCVVFRSRVYNESYIDAELATSLKSKCPSIGQDDNLASLDAISPVTFDTGYFKDLVNKKGLLHTDQQLYNGSSSTASQVSTYTTSTFSFFEDFASAMIKMGNLSPPSGTSGEIRTNCARVN